MSTSILVERLNIIHFGKQSKYFANAYSFGSKNFTNCDRGVRLRVVNNCKGSLFLIHALSTFVN